MGSAFHQLCPKHSETLTPTAPTAIRLWETCSFFLILMHFRYSFCYGELSAFSYNCDSSMSDSSLYHIYFYTHFVVLYKIHIFLVPSCDFLHL